MPIVLRRFQSGDADSIERFNARMAAGDSPHRLYPEDLSRNPTADLDIRPINDSLYVVADEPEVRGGTWLREQYFWVQGERHRVGWMKYAIAESLIDAKYSTVPLIMVRSLLLQQPRLLALGMGGHDTPFSRLLSAVKWQSSTVPFFFHVFRPFRVLRGLEFLRQRTWMRTAMDLAAWSGAGWMANTLFQATSFSRAEARGTKAIPEPMFTPWADAVWERCRGDYRALAVRDSRSLDQRYSSPQPGIHRLRIEREGSDIGWVCAQLSESAELAAYFGDLRVGVLVDMLAHTSDAGAVLRAGLGYLRALGTDIVVTNVSHEAWTTAARRLRFLEGPSTLAFYRSPQADVLMADGADLTQCHFTRGDD